MKYKEFYNELLKHRLITPIWNYILDLLNGEIKDQEDKDTYLNLFSIYFSLIDAGNATMSLKEDILKEKWSLLVSDQKVLESEREENVEESFKELDEESSRIISDKYLKNIVFLTKIVGNGKVFEVENDYLYLKKYFVARNKIKESVERLFIKQSFKNEEKFTLENAYKKGGIKPFSLTNMQTKVVKDGLNNNLIVTGGPGTGKTTSILFILLYLLSNNLDYNIYLAAASGKAASRMKESIINGIERSLDEDFIKNHQDIINKIKGTYTSSSTSSTEEFTIHRLLSIDYESGSFKYNKDNKFPKNSIFIIDESSMIDICLFSSLFEAMEEGSRIFILGDKNQLPSVEVGAVFADLLEHPGLKKIELDESKRFNENTDIFKLASKVNNGEDLGLNNDLFKDPSTFEIYEANKSCPVYYYLNNADNKTREQKKIIEGMLKKWSDKFYKDVQKDCSDLSITSTIENFNKVFNYTESAKILTAENQGVRGVQQLNSYIKKKVISSNPKGLNNHFAGEVMMITKNNKLLDLYNGDTGILVTFENDDTLYFMVKKASKLVSKDEYNKDNIFMLNGFVFYPFREISLNEIDLAYAITIHKSQGSDYDNILVILPTSKGHPLLNRQIVYTAITRTKGNTYILSNLDSLNEAKDRIIKRDTNINK